MRRQSHSHMSFTPRLPMDYLSMALWPKRAKRSLPMVTTWNGEHRSFTFVRQTDVFFPSNETSRSCRLNFKQPRIPQITRRQRNVTRLPLDLRSPPSDALLTPAPRAATVGQNLSAVARPRFHHRLYPERKTARWLLHTFSFAHGLMLLLAASQYGSMEITCKRGRCSRESISLCHPPSEITKWR